MTAAFKDVFISYGRIDSKDFAIRLKTQLEQAGVSVWLDLNDIPLGVDFQQNIDTSILRAHSFLFLISPHSANSKYCTLEIEQALRFKKRLIPVMHVEEIAAATWQARHPQSTEAEWQEYRAQNRHKSQPNLHPEIRKLNWVPFQEEQVDFDQGVAKLIALLQTEADYVRKHTKILNQAFLWRQRQQQTRYLLSGKACQNAAAWLIEENELVSCQPSELHCDYISASLKNAHNLMCQVFLSHAEEDASLAQEIRYRLTRHSFTVWTNRTDIRTGEDFPSAIRRGVEQADNLVYLISPEAVESPYCQAELQQAIALNKRIIPMLIYPTERKKIPEVLQRIQYIDLHELTTADPTTALKAGTERLIQALQIDKSYCAEHKELLVKALKWQRQKNNSSLLLRGQALSHYRSWLHLAQQRTLYGPTQLQEEFIAASAAQPPDLTLDVFIIANLADLDFARQLNNKLQVYGKSTWFEQESLVPDIDEKEATASGLTISENVIYILSPEAADSRSCSVLLEGALALNKRILVVCYGATGSAQVPPALASCPAFDFRDNSGDFDSNLGNLYRILESNPSYVREHTRLLAKAREWQQDDEDDSLLLQGRSLQAAEQWLQQASDSSPAATALQRRYIQASGELPKRRIRPRGVIVIGVASTLAISLCRLLGLFQAAELQAYSHLLRTRAQIWREGPDQRFTLIEVDRQSGIYLRDKMKEGAYKPSIGTVPDQALLEMLNTLAAHEPALIGLDIYRDFQADTEVEGLGPILEEMDNLVGICKTEIIPEQGERINNRDLGGFSPIYEVASADYPKRIGFNDLLTDADGRLRRHYLAKAAEVGGECPVEAAFSLVLAQRYLEAQAATFAYPFNTAPGSVMPDQLAWPEVPHLRAQGADTGGLYDVILKDPNRLGGYQTLVNFRAAGGRYHKYADPREFAETLSLMEILENSFDPAQIRDRIVLIGITDQSDKSADTWRTPFGTMTGVVVHGQMASQLISAVMDDRPLIWWLSPRYELLWLLGWAAAGGFIAWGFYRPGPMALAAAGSILIIYGTAWGGMVLSAGLIPTVPAIAALLVTGSIVLYRNHRLRRV